MHTYSPPGAIGMYALSLGVQRINEILPLPLCALLSGLNTSTVGIVALSAVQLAEKAIEDKLTRLLGLFEACAGLFLTMHCGSSLCLCLLAVSSASSGGLDEPKGWQCEGNAEAEKLPESTAEEAVALDSGQSDDRS